MCHHKTMHHCPTYSLSTKKIFEIRVLEYSWKYRLGMSAGGRAAKISTIHFKPKPDCQSEMVRLNITNRLFVPRYKLASSSPLWWPKSISRPSQIANQTYRGRTIMDIHHLSRKWKAADTCAGSIYESASLFYHSHKSRESTEREGNLGDLRRKNNKQFMESGRHMWRVGWTTSWTPLLLQQYLRITIAMG